MSELIKGQENIPSFKMPILGGASQDIAIKTKVKEVSNHALSESEIKAFFDKERSKGYDEGLKKGYAEGVKNAAEEIEKTKASILVIADNFNKALSKHDEVISERILKLALDISKAMLKVSIRVKSELILPILQDTLNKIPVVDRPARILLNKADADLVNATMGVDLSSHGWIVTENPSFEQGDCLIETASNQIDSTNETRWKRISEALGHHDDWND